jgi:hypothetical protein
MIALVNTRRRRSLLRVTPAVAMLVAVTAAPFARAQSTPPSTPPRTPPSTPPSTPPTGPVAAPETAPTQPAQIDPATGAPVPVQRIVLHTHQTLPALGPGHTETTPTELRTPGPGRVALQLEHSAPDADFSLVTGEDEIPRSMRRGQPIARQTVCHGNCLIYVPSTRPVRVSASVHGGTDVSTDVSPPPEGVRLRFQTPSRGALIASYVLYPTAAALAVGGTLAALLIQDSPTRLGSAIGLFSGAALVLAVGITTNVVAFDGTVRTQPVAPTSAPSPSPAGIP